MASLGLLLSWQNDITLLGQFRTGLFCPISLNGMSDIFTRSLCSMTTIVQFTQEAYSSAVPFVRVGIFLGHKIANANES
jgi:hypothetical protein